MSPTSMPVTPFAAAAARWADLSFVVVPATPDGSRPAVPTWQFSAEAQPARPPPGCPSHARVAPTAPTRDGWNALRSGSAAPLLLLDSSTGGREDLCVVAVDDLKWVDWAVATFGRTPYVVNMGRGAHLYYRVPRGHGFDSFNGLLGPVEAYTERETFGVLRTKIDFKARRSYVAAAGTVDIWGCTHTASATMTPELFAQLPCMDPGVLAREKHRHAPDNNNSPRLRRMLTPGHIAHAMTSLDFAVDPDLAALPSGASEPRNWTRADFFGTLVEGGGDVGQVELGGLPKGTRLKCPFHADEPFDSMVILHEGELAFCHSKQTTFAHRADGAGLAPTPPPAVSTSPAWWSWVTRGWGHVSCSKGRTRNVPHTPKLGCRNAPQPGWS